LRFEESWGTIEATAWRLRRMDRRATDDRGGRPAGRVKGDLLSPLGGGSLADAVQKPRALGFTGRMGENRGSESGRRGIQVTRQVLLPR
jgi:hypothetical protein